MTSKIDKDSPNDELFLEFQRSLTGYQNGLNNELKKIGITW